MKLSTERVLTTHVGSLPRPPDVSEMLLAKEDGTLADRGAFDARMEGAVADVVRQQVDAGVDVVSDGEMSKIGYSTYIKDRLNGFSGDSPRRVPADLALYPDYVQRIAAQGQTPKLKRTMCTGEIGIKDEAPLEKDIANMAAALEGAGAVEGFMNAASPGVISLFQPNRHYPSQDAYLEALAAIMRAEYEAIHAAGFVIQLDCPDLAMGRHTMYADESEEAFVAHAAAQVEALNHALATIPAEAARLHLCWGNYEGPHVCDIELGAIYDVVMKAKPQAISFEAANPRHAHEWSRLRRARRARGQGSHSRRDRFGLQLRGAPGAGGGAHLPLRRHRRPRARARRRRLRLRHLRGLRQDRPGHLLRQAAHARRGRGHGHRPALVRDAS